MAHKQTVFTFITILLLMLWGQTSIHAQDDQPAPEFLYRDGNHLVLVNGYTGESSTLPFEVTERDRFVWSPDGQYLLAHLFDGENEGYCLNLYDVDQQKWRHDKPISCAAQFTIFDDEGSHLYYTTNDKVNGKLWVYNMADESSRELYQTTEGNELYPAGISEFEWSPTDTYLTFKSYKFIMGGTVNVLVVLNSKTEKYAVLNAPNSYYASYNPIWSSDDLWILLILKEEYVVSGSLPRTNHLGDIYLVNSETGEKYRLTYTPTLIKRDIHWTDDSRIAFTELIEQNRVYTIEEAMNIEPVPDDAIIEPERFESENSQGHLANVMVSPDTNLGAWIEPSSENDNQSLLVVGKIVDLPHITEFAVEIANPKQFPNIIIGWRPSNYPYSRG